MTNEKEQQWKYDQMMFENIEHILLNDTKPSNELTKLSETKEFKESSFFEMNRLKSTEQSKVHHPEGNVWIHTMMVVDEAAKVKEKSKNPRIFMWSAFLHDIGKIEATKIRKGKITAYDHDKIGARKAKKLLDTICCDKEFTNQVVAMVRWHMQILFIAKNMAFSDLDAMKREVEIEEVALLGMCDRLGRLGVNKEDVKRDIDRFLQKARYS